MPCRTILCLFRTTAAPPGRVWNQNFQMFLTSTNKHNPEFVPMEFVNFISDVANIQNWLPHFRWNSSNKKSQDTIPFNTRRSLEFQDFNLDELNPSDDLLFGATGRRVQPNTVTKAQAAACFLLSRKNIHRINAVSWSNLNLAFDISEFTDLFPALPAQHALKTLLLAKTNFSQQAGHSAANRHPWYPRSRHLC